MELNQYNAPTNPSKVKSLRISIPIASGPITKTAADFGLDRIDRIKIMKSNDPADIAGAGTVSVLLGGVALVDYRIQSSGGTIAYTFLEVYNGGNRTNDSVVITPQAAVATQQGLVIIAEQF